MVRQIKIINYAELFRIYEYIKQVRSHSFTLSRIRMYLEISLVVASYLLVYSSRNVLTSASAYLIEKDTITKNTYAIMQTCALASIFVCKLASGFIAEKISRHRKNGFGRLIALYLAIPLLNTLAMFALVYLGTQLLSGHVAQNAIIATFVLSYTVLKVMSSSFARPFAIQMFHTITEKTAARRANNAHRDPDAERVRFARLGSLLQVAACLGDMMGKILLGSLLQSSSLLRYAADHQYVTWAMPLLTVASVGALAIPVVILLFAVQQHNKTPQYNFLKTTTTSGSNDGRTSKTILRELFRNRRFNLSLLISIANAAISIALTTYLSHFMAFVLRFDTADVTRMDAATPLVVMVVIGIGSYMMTRLQNAKQRVTHCLIVPYVVSFICVMAVVYMLHSQSHHRIVELRTWYLALLFMFNAFFYCTNCLIDGAYLMLHVKPEDASIAAGLISGTGYIGAIIVPFCIAPFSTTLTGWLKILYCVGAIQLVVMFLLVALQQLDVKAQKTTKRKFRRPM